MVFVLSKEHALPTTERLSKAEELRKAGSYADAAALVETINVLNFDSDVLRFNNEQFVRYLTAVRLCFGSSFSAAKRAINPFSVIYLWKQTQKYVKLYEHLFEDGRVLSVKQGIYGEAYDFAGEISRDLIRYQSYITSLRGFGYYSLSVNLRQLAERVEEPSLKELLQVESLRAFYLSFPRQDVFDDVFGAWEVSVESEKEALRWERAATITARVYVIAPTEIQKKKLADEYANILKADPTVASIWKRETSILRRAIEKPLLWYQRILLRRWLSKATI